MAILYPGFQTLNINEILMKTSNYKKYFDVKELFLLTFIIYIFQPKN